MSYFRLACFLLSTTLYVNCNSQKNNDCSTKLFEFGNQKFIAKGCLADSVENGLWSFYNENKMISTGQYNNGIRVGIWQYPENKSDSAIEWRKYEDKRAMLIFNIPSRLSFVANNDSSLDVKFSNLDSTKPFTVIISPHKIEETNKQIENYYKQGEEEITANGWKFKRESQKILTKSRELYMHTYNINVSENRNFNVLNIYRLMSDGNLLEISCRYSKSIESSAKIIFFSVVSNCFYNHTRFIDPLEKMEYISIN